MTWWQVIGTVASLVLLIAGGLVKWRAHQRRKRESRMEEDIDRLSDGLDLGDKP